MSRIAYVNGRFVAQKNASVAMEDRGYQFGDGVYEVVAFYYGQMLDAALHLDRLERSLAKMDIPMPMSRSSLELKITQLLAQNSQRHGLVYIQVTRGVAMRNHVYKNDIVPVLTMSCLPASVPDDTVVRKGASVILAEDIRWARCDIKTTALLANSMLRMQSYHKKARETWLVRDDVITEGSSTNAYIVTSENHIKTHPANHHILAGITRDVVLNLARSSGIDVDETAFTPHEALAAKEAFLTSASSHIQPVVRIDEARIGDANAGAITLRLMKLYKAHVSNQIGRAL